MTDEFSKESSINEQDSMAEKLQNMDSKENAKLEHNYEENEEAHSIEYEDDYLSLWHKNHHGSIDLDEKFTSMTGSYSEILDDRKNEDDKTNTSEVLSSEEAYMSTMHQLCTNIEDKRRVSQIEKQSSKGAIPKSVRPHETNDAGPWRDISDEENVSQLVRDFSEKNIISELPIKQKENFFRTAAALGSSSSQGLPRSLLYPPLPPIDPTVIGDLEDHARSIATSMDTLIENLTGTLHSISALSVECVETYRDSVCKTCDAVDSNIKSMYQLMAKCEELSKSMKPVYRLHDQIKEVKRLLDLFEGVVYSGGGIGSGGAT